MLFSLYRIHVLPNDVMTLFASELTGPERGKLLMDRLLNPIDGGVYRNTKYRIYNTERVEGMQAVVGRLSHPDEIDRTLPDASGTRLTDLREESEAWTHFVYLGEGEQVIAVQRRSEFFSGGDDGLGQLLDAVLNGAVNDDRVRIIVKAVETKGTFWSEIESAEELFRVDFTFVAPNMFGGRRALADLVGLQTRLHNAAELHAGVENPDGKLRFPRNAATQAEVAYAEEGGGDWKIVKRDKGGSKREVRSDASGVAQIPVVDDDGTKQSIIHRAKEIIAAMWRVIA